MKRSRIEKEIKEYIKAAEHWNETQDDALISTHINIVCDHMWVHYKVYAEQVEDVINDSDDIFISDDKELYLG